MKQSYKFLVNVFQFNSASSGYHMVGHPRCVFINYIGLINRRTQLILWWIDVYYLVLNYMFRRLWPSSG